MAGNLYPDNSGNIYVEFDYNNLIVVDPNKTIDNSGKINDRLVDHENLVMYANLEAAIIPRTKLSIGGDPGDAIRNVTIARMNFLKPTNDDYLNSGYLDEITGKDSTKYEAINQPKEILFNSNGSNPYYYNTVVDSKNVTDNGLLGIKNISIKISSSFIPEVTMKLEDVQGKALFQLGDNSPYAAFFNLPYCQFILTIKGYYGMAVKYILNLETFNASYNDFTGNYSVDLKFLGYKFNILAEITMGHLLAAPHMYSKIFDVNRSDTSVQSNLQSLVTTNLTQNNNLTNTGFNERSNSSDEISVSVVTEKGYQKILEVYSEYKSKGILPYDFPELTLLQLMNKIEMFEQNIVNSLIKINVDPLTNIRVYKETLVNYYNKLRGDANSWFAKYMDPQPLILLDGSQVYIFKKLTDLVKSEARSELKKIIDEYNKLLNENETLGMNSGSSPIVNTITYDNIKFTINTSQIDWGKTTTTQTGVLEPTSTDINSTINKYRSIFNISSVIPSSGDLTLIPNDTDIFDQTFIFDGVDRFESKIRSIESLANKKLGQFESAITKQLQEYIQDKDTGIGFVPTVRNIVAVIMASTEGFIRLMDDVHTNAWDVKNDPVRKNAVLNNQSSAPSSDKIDFSTDETPVYPWPQIFVETPDDKKGRFQLKYPGDPTIVNLTKGYLSDKWPEVEFVEEYLKGLTQKFNPPISQPPYDPNDSSIILNINAILLGLNSVAYFNKEEVKFFYEIWERQYVTSHYSGLVRLNQNEIDDLLTLNNELEVTNIVDSINNSSPFLALKLKQFNITSQNFDQVLRNISNSGTGTSYQDFIRGFFVTPYLRNATQNTFSILNLNDLGKLPNSVGGLSILKTLATTANNIPLIVDTFPFTDNNWVVNNMAASFRSANDKVYSSNRVLTVFDKLNVLSNFEDVSNVTTNRPVTNFNYLKQPDDLTSLIYSLGDLSQYYSNNSYSNLLPTESVITYNSPRFGEISTTTSVLNSPYFVNSILVGVNNDRSGVKYPYVASAYLFINSLPLTTLRERYLSLDNSELDYIFATMNKFGAIHKLPYAWILKLGSIYHRYKNYVTSGNDILDDVWNNFDYVKNYDPVTENIKKQYTFTYNSTTSKVILQDDNQSAITMSVGFYPKVINDFNYFYNGFDLYSQYSDAEIQKSIDLGLKVYNFGGSNIFGSQNNIPISLNTWSLVIKEFNLVPDTDPCDPADTLTNYGYFMIPSFGSRINQTTNECFNPNDVNSSTIVNLTNNASVFNGSVRTIWALPNYGYFDTNLVKKPEYNQYPTKILNDRDDQIPFIFKSDANFSYIEEIFSVFDKEILDKFELEFLNFSKSVNDSDVSLIQTVSDQNVNDISLGFTNFQSLFKSIMKVSRSSNNQSDDSYFNDIVKDQSAIFNSMISSFLSYDVVFKYGNPSRLNRRVFESYLSHNSDPTITNPIIFGNYVSGSLPDQNGNITLTSSRSRFPLEWQSLELNVGFSTIDGLRYSNFGSYITDFFIQNNILFSQSNIELLSPIIRMYATQKLNNDELTIIDFKSNLTQYLASCENLQDNILNVVMNGVRAKLPNQQELPEKTITSAVFGDQNKIELYDMFKSLNDKWIAGADFKNKTIFEDFLFLDRASRNIGDTILVNIFDLKKTLNKNSLNQAMSVYTFIASMLFENNFTIMNLPAYVNFYNIQDPSINAIPNPEGSLEFANNMWGTFLNVDYRKSSPKIVCFYTGVPSRYLDIKNSNIRYRDDSFEMRRSSENPLIENQVNKTDWAMSNKCVGFTVDLGIRNQNIFHSINVSQANGKATTETINTVLDMVNNSSGRNVATQNVSLYNLYKQRSYGCEINSLGNAMIQPTMYFNLRHVPMFNGPYFITDVIHEISPGSFKTKFSGVRQSIYDLPSIDTYLQSINQNLLTKIESILKIKKPSTTTVNIASPYIQKSVEVVQQSNNTKADQSTCVVAINEYSTYLPISPINTSLNPKKFAELLASNVANDNLRTIIFVLSYIRTYTNDSNSNLGSFKGFNNNFATITLENFYGDGSSSFLSPTYTCVNVNGKSKPIAIFNSEIDYINFMEGRLSPIVDRILSIGLARYYVCFWPVSNGITIDEFDRNKNQYTTLINTINAAQKLAQSVGLKLISKLSDGQSNSDC